jgi:hypothetical protein
MWWGDRLAQAARPQKSVFFCVLPCSVIGFGFRPSMPASESQDIDRAGFRPRSKIFSGR